MKSVSVLELEGLTKGQAETVLAAGEHRSGITELLDEAQSPCLLCLQQMVQVPVPR